MAEKGKKMYSKGYVVAQANEMAKKAGVNKITILNLPQEMNKEGYEYCMGIVKQAIAASQE